MNTPRFGDPRQDRGHGGGRRRSHGEGHGRDRDDAHPSYLALDRAALGSQTAQLTSHLVGCERCRAHIERIAAAPPVPEVTIARLRRQEAARRPARAAPRRARFAAGLVAVAAAAVLVVAILVERDRPGQLVADRSGGEAHAPGYDTAKGGRAVGVYVRRGRHTFLWNGSEPVQPGDALRLKLVPDGMTEVHVFSETPGPRGGAAVELTLLHRARLAPEQDTLLETAWRIDAAGEREVLVVVLSRRPIARAAARAAARAGGMGDHTWVTRLVMPKRPPAGADAGAPRDGSRPHAGGPALDSLAPDALPAPAPAGPADPAAGVAP